ncbi:T-box transcription factor TBX22-like [Pristis pectinata]|uniref:T-box transcription factor TBX22-like n=1 Tax=Pristis pectinata TaxID=685728 RepID=UPI00223CB5BE|nr:T-box transcription factor TBX22-like [Pristis pectinata]
MTSVLQTMVDETNMSLQRTKDVLTRTAGELAAVRLVALQNRMALDYLLAADGGICAAASSRPPQVPHLTLKKCTFAWRCRQERAIRSKLFASWNGIESGAQRESDRSPSPFPRISPTALSIRAGVSPPMLDVGSPMALSSRAHAFSVESLVGNSLKRKHEDIGNGKLRGRFNDMRNRPGEPKYEEDEQSEEARAEGAKTLTSPSPGSLGGASEGPQVELQGTDLWKRFHEIGTEMIITKAGRRMFPAVRVKIRGLEPEQHYYIAMDIIPVDSKRYRYVYHSSQWMVAGNSEQSPLTPRLYVHPDSPTSGQSWMKQVISFDRVKLTNNDLDQKGHIILQSMHRYRPRIHVVVKEADTDLSVNQRLPPHGLHTFAFPETEFTTVTAYQNQQITRLKIDRNPFAKGFRDPGRNRVGLEQVMDNYPWRPTNCRPSLGFQAFDIQKTAGCFDCPLGRPGTGTRSELLPTCSPGLLHFGAGSLAVTCRNTARYSPVCDKGGPGPQRFALPACDTSPPDLLVTQRAPPLMLRVPSVSSLTALTGRGGEGSGHGLHLAPTVLLSHLAHPAGTEAQPDLSPHGWCARRPHSLCGYSVSAPSRLAAGPLKLGTQRTAGSPVTEQSFREGKTVRWTQTVNHCL